MLECFKRKRSEGLRTKEELKVRVHMEETICGRWFMKIWFLEKGLSGINLPTCVICLLSYEFKPMPQQCKLSLYTFSLSQLQLHCPTLIAHANIALHSSQHLSTQSFASMIRAMKLWFLWPLRHFKATNSNARLFLSFPREKFTAPWKALRDNLQNPTYKCLYLFCE